MIIIQHTKNLKKEIKTTLKTTTTTNGILELKSIIIKMKNLFHGLHTIFEMTEESMCLKIGQ